MMKYNTTLKQLPISSITEFQSFLKEIKGITLLTYGESDLPVNKEIKSELITSLLNLNDKYTSSSGLLELRQTIAKKENKNLYNYTKDNVLITNGSTEALFLLLSSIINPLDEVIICKPYYPLYKQILTYLKATIIEVNHDDSFNIDISDLKNKINGKTKAIILNYPNNPSGSVLTESVLLQLKKLFLKYKTHIILDNVYEDIVFEKHNSLSDFPELHEQISIVNSLSKSQGLTGWRLGYLLSSAEIISLSTKLHQMINICLPHFLMDSMNFALNLKTNIDFYQQNAKFAYNYLKKLGLQPFKPKGGYYIVFRIDQFNMDSITFCKKLALEYHLGLLPGVFFSLENYVRISISYDFKKLSYGLSKLKTAIKDIKKV